MTRFLLGLLALMSCGGAVRADGLKAGAATADITPPIGFAMWGYGARHDLPSEGVLDPLKARALVLELGGESFALVGLDLGRAPPRSSFQAIRDRVRKEGISTIFLVASHTHHGPVLEVDDWPDAKTSYVRSLERTLGDVILAAHKARRPARFGVASRELPFNRNRHSKRPDAPVDREFLVLRVEDAAGRPIAHAVHFAAHPTMTEAKKRFFSADYPGFLAGVVEKETGAPCLFLQGAEGDLSTNAGEHAGPQRFGEQLGREALALMKTIRCAEPTKGTFAVREEEFAFKSRVDLGNRLTRSLYVAAFFEGLVRFYEREYRDGVRPRLTAALLDNRIGIVGVSGEFFCGHSLSLKRRARLDHVLFLGLCNDYQQYFPTIEAAAEGGYGADMMVSPAEVGAGERVVDRALIHLHEMRRR